MLRLLDGIAKRYGCRPSEVLRSTQFDLAIDIACYDQGRSDDAALAKSSGAMAVFDPTG